MQIIDFNEVEAVNFDGNTVNTVILNGKHIWSTMFNFAGIDANGRFEGEVEYTTPVAYAIGKKSFEYYKIITPTPTTQEEVVGKYYLNATTFTEITTSNVSNIELGVTEIFEKVATKSEATHTGKEILYTNCGLNSEYFGLEIDKSYLYGDLVDLGITELIIPNYHNGLPVTTIIGGAFWGWTSDGSSDYYYPTFKIRRIVLGNNVETLEGKSIVQMCNTYSSNIGVVKTNDFVWNNSIKTINTGSIWGLFGENYDLSLPSSVTYFSGEATRGDLLSSLPSYTLNSLTINTVGAFESQKGATYAIGDVGITKSLIFKNTVTSFTGDLLASAGTSSQGTSNIVFEHTDNDTITLNVDSVKTAISCTIYTDNTYIRNYDWAGKNITVTFKSLSEYGGV